MVQRTLSIVILFLALLSGVTLFMSTAPLHSLDRVKQTQSSTERGIAERMFSVPSQVVSRLSLFPSLSKEKRFVAVMIENHEDARPHQEGVEHALMVQEFLVEGFISRFVIVLDAARLPSSIGPVRSLRPYFLDAIKPWANVVFHAGGSPEALERVENGNEFFARNILYFDDEHGSLRNKDVAPPHNLFLKRSFISKQLQDVPDFFWRDAEWPPFEVGVPEGGIAVDTLRINFFSSLHNTMYEFLPLAQKYKRTSGSTVSTARPANVVILEVPIDEIGAYGRLFMTQEGSGNALVFHSGKMWEGRWSRSTLQSAPRLLDAEGKDIPLAHGQIWMTVLPTLERVSWEEVNAKTPAE